MTSHPDIFAALVNRHRDIIFENNAENVQQMPNDVNNVGAREIMDVDDADVFDIPRLNMGLRVNQEAISFTQSENNDSDIEDHDEDSNDDEDIVHVPHMGVQMRVNAHAILITRYENDNENEHENEA